MFLYISHNNNYYTIFKYAKGMEEGNHIVIILLVNVVRYPKKLKKSFSMKVELVARYGHTYMDLSELK